MPARTFQAPAAATTGRNAVDQIFFGLGRIHDMLALRRQREALRNLEDHQLEDIGVTRAQADDEANRAAWDVPSHWQGKR